MPRDMGEARTGSVWPLCEVRLNHVRVFKGLFDMHKQNQAVLVVANKPRITESATQSEHQLCPAGERGPR